jgi:hypothetical protein
VSFEFVLLNWFKSMEYMCPAVEERRVRWLYSDNFEIIF